MSPEITTSLILEQPVPEDLSPDFLDFFRFVPLGVDKGRLRIAVAETPATHVLEDLEKLYGVPVELVRTSEEALADAIRRVKAAAEPVVELLEDLDAASAPGDDRAPADVRELANQAPVVRFVSHLIREAADAHASDIHLDATREGLQVRLRVDGVLADIAAPPRALQAAVRSRLKILANLDIAERQRPQDGRVRVRLEQRELDLRVVVAPTHFGESVTLRLLDGAGRPAGLAELGMAPDTLAAVEALARRPHGILLVTGPTGSGKTTTLYAALGLRDKATEKIVTVEDPVEYELPGVTQIAVGERLGFAQALRTLLRMDPDVLMVGEMRDEESADIAVRAAMTGHLVLSTLHTNDAIGAIPRLLDLKVPSYLVAGTIEGVLAQRLVRKVCAGCRQRYKADPQVVALLADRPVGAMKLERGAGCAACRHTGYRGRTGIFELLLFDDALKDAVTRGPDLSTLRRLAGERAMRTLKQDGWAKVQAGVTTVEEVLRVVQ